MNKSEWYASLCAQLSSLLAGNQRKVTILANASALLYDALSDVNWAGFYLYDEEQDALYLGPFQGKPACVHIPNGKGVCGSALVRRAVLRVDNVLEFPGHIACDSASRSEIVLPLIKKDTCLGVLDIDSARLRRFDEADEAGLNAFVDVLIRFL